MGIDICGQEQASVRIHASEEGLKASRLDCGVTGDRSLCFMIM